MAVRESARPVAHVAALALVAAFCVGDGTGRMQAASPDTAPPLAPPTGTVINVSTLSQLQNAVASAASGATIRIAPGTYRLTAQLYLNRAVRDLVIRGATSSRHDVVLQGPGMTNAAVEFGIWTGNGVTRLTIANLTIRDIYYHPIIFNEGTQQPRVYNVRLVNAGQQFVKANPDGAGGGVNGGIIEYSVMEYDTVAPSDYTNGVDVHTGDGWIIRHNLFRRIRAAQGLAGPAVLMWNHSRNTIIESNTFIDNHRDISLGLITRAPDDHTGGIVRNNMIVRTAGAGGDVGIAVFDSPGTKVLHNTIWLGGAYPNAIEYRFPDTTGLTIAHNLSDGAITAREGATATVTGNVTTATAAYFTHPEAGDLHLTAAAILALDRVTAPAEVETDWDGQARPAAGLADVGADERGALAAPPPPGRRASRGMIGRAMPTRAYRAGQTAEDYCRACRVDRIHTVVVVDGDGQPLRVSCDFCRSEHNFRGGARMAIAGTPISPSAGRSARPIAPAAPAHALPLVSEREISEPAMSDPSAINLEALLRRIIREEIGLTPAAPADKWRGGDLVLRPGRSGVQEKSWPIETFFHKIVMLRNRLRTLEQQLNASDLPDDQKLKLQSYITGCYGSLTTFNVLFADDADRFVGAGE